MTSPFAMMDRLAGLQLDCPVMFESLAGASDRHPEQTVRATASEGLDEVATVAILSEN